MEVARVQLGVADAMNTVHPRTPEVEHAIAQVSPALFPFATCLNTFIFELEKLLPGLTRGQKFQKRNSEAEMEFFTKPQIFRQKAAKRGIVRNQHKTECDLWLVTCQSNWDLFRL